MPKNAYSINRAELIIRAGKATNFEMLNAVADLIEELDKYQWFFGYAKHQGWIKDDLKIEEIACADD